MEDDKIDISQTELSVQDYTPSLATLDATSAQKMQAPIVQIMPSNTISISGTNAQEKLSGETPSPTPVLVMPSINTTKKYKRKKKKKISPPSKSNTMDEFIELLDWDLMYLTFEETIILQDVLAKKEETTGNLKGETTKESIA